MLRVGPAGFKLEMISNLLRTVDGHEARLRTSSSQLDACVRRRSSARRSRSVAPCSVGNGIGGVESSQRYGGPSPPRGPFAEFFPGRPDSGSPHIFRPCNEIHGWLARGHCLAGRSRRVFSRFPIFGGPADEHFFRINQEPWVFYAKTGFTGCSPQL
jgi:hypothetical protein